MPESEQFFLTYESEKTGRKVFKHLLVHKKPDFDSDDYNDLDHIAKLVSDTETTADNQIINGDVYIMPEISEKTIKAREKLLPNAVSRTAPVTDFKTGKEKILTLYPNPDFKINGEYFELKRPGGENIVSNAVTAAYKQLSTPILYNKKGEITYNKMDTIGGKIFIDKNFKDKNYVFFEEKGEIKYIKKGTQKKTKEDKQDKA